MGEVVIAVAKEVIINILVKEVVKRVLKKQLRANIIIRESHYINEYNVVYFGGYYERVEKRVVKGSNSQIFRLGKGDGVKIIIFQNVLQLS